RHGDFALPRGRRACGDDVGRRAVAENLLREGGQRYNGGHPCRRRRLYLLAKLCSTSPFGMKEQTLCAPRGGSFFNPMWYLLLPPETTIPLSKNGSFLPAARCDA